MPKDDSHPRFKFVRSAIREDLLYFAAPALLVFTAGLVVSSLEGYGNLMGKLWQLVNQPGNLSSLSWQNMLGLALYVIGLTIAIVAQYMLQRSYAPTLVIREDHQLVTHGIYRYTRHPVYLGVIIAIVGLPIFASSLYGLLIMFALIPIFLYRIKMEERLLTEEFGDAYQTYQETTSKLVPFIY
jgi:protein-S-isoprenylcysteine O-methyltransferase Ste14